jgi:hypothetical protein
MRPPPDPCRESHGKVDLAEQQDEAFADPQEHNDGRLDEEVDEVPIREEQRALDLEDDDDRDERTEYRQHTALASPNPPPPREEVVPERVGQDFGCR